MRNLLEKYTCGNSRLLHILTEHSEAVRDLALEIACNRNLDVDREFIAEAAMLHDIGIVKCDAPSISCFGTLPYICHGTEGARILRLEGLPRHALVAERHTGAGISASEIVARNLPIPPRDYLPISLEEKLICYADKFYSKSRDLREHKPLEKIRAQMAEHGVGTAARFAELELLFGDPFTKKH